MPSLNKMLNFCVSLTTIPSRFKTIKKTIDSINKQTKKPNKIFLNIPHNYKRYPKKDYDITDLGNIFDNLQIVRCEDYGPGTKLLGSLNKIVKYDTAIVIDDDSIYHRDFCKMF